MLHLLLAAVTATVTATSSRWVGDVMITEAEVVDTSGATLKVVQLGGSVDGLAMTFTHQPPLVEIGDVIAIDVATRSVVGVVARPRLVPAGGSATYGVQRTTKSGTALWHASGCVELTYDSTTIDPATATVIDEAFAAWSSAAAGCGHVTATSTRRPNPPSTRDEMWTVRIRRDRWCNPGNAIEAPICYSADASAVTRLLFVDDPSEPDDGRIMDADIELNAVDYVLLAPGETAPATTKSVLDLQAVATHEAGHALGLAHNCGTGHEAWPADHEGNAVPACDTASPQVKAATMFFAIAPGDVGPRSIEVTDVAGACEVARELTCEGFVEGGCRATKSHTGAWCIVLCLILIRRRKWAAMIAKRTHMFRTLADADQLVAEVSRR